MPNVLLRVCIGLLFDTTNVINVSLRAGIFPDDFKEAHEKPLIKMIILPKDKLKKDIPDSTFSLFSKIQERV